jgi:hypothetical protein
MSTSTLICLIIGLSITIGLPLAIYYLIKRRTSMPGAVPVIGATFGLISLAFTVPLNAYVWPLVFGSRLATGTLVMSSVTIGVISEVARYGAFRYPRRMRFYRDHEGALAAGFGDGAVNSILAGLQFVAGVGITTILPGKFSPEVINQTLINGGPLIIFNALRQIPLIACSMALAILIVFAFRRHSVAYVLAAMAAHTLVLLLYSTLPFPWGAAVLSLSGGLSLLLIYWVVRSGVIKPFPRPEDTTPVDHGIRIAPGDRASRQRQRRRQQQEEQEPKPEPEQQPS